MGDTGSFPSIEDQLTLCESRAGVMLTVMVLGSDHVREARVDIVL